LSCNASVYFDFVGDDQMKITYNDKPYILVSKSG